MKYSLFVLYVSVLLLWVSGLTVASNVKFVWLDHWLTTTTMVWWSNAWENMKKGSITVDVRQAMNTQSQSDMQDEEDDTSSDIISESDIEVGVTTWTKPTWVQSDIVYINDWQYVDMKKVRNTWLDWTNYLRTQQLWGRNAYDSDWRLDATATAWSQSAAALWNISHKRKSSDGYYNYNWLVSWFKWKWAELTGNPIVFRNVGRATFSESIGWWWYACSESDCTDEVIEGTRGTWNFFYGERSSNGVHYRALTHKNFGIQWLGLAFSGKKYYLTIHYGTQILE